MINAEAAESLDNLRNPFMEQLIISSILDDIARIQSDYLLSKPIGVRKELGQYFTGVKIAKYMASIINVPPDVNTPVSILDAGAGSGILSAAAALHLLNQGIKNIHIVAYEIDTELTLLLRQTYSIIKNICQERQSRLTFEIKNLDFILHRPDQSNELNMFDISVINPPYFKYNVKMSPYSKTLSDLYSGDPNIYASFMAVALNCLNNSGQLISITPRSFTNGLYFKGFRKYILSNASLTKVHVFKHRGKLFSNDESSVLQENIICKYSKVEKQKSIEIRTSDCDASLESPFIENYPKDVVIDQSNEQNIIRIPESKDDYNILLSAGMLNESFDGAGYFISTGPVVEHRTQEFIERQSVSIEHDSVPLFRPHNVKPIYTGWTGSQPKDVVFKLLEGFEKHVVENNNYVLLKRLTSKDEKRRLIAGVYLKSCFDGRCIGFGNKVNYIGLKSGNLSKAEAVGLAVLFNSTFMDKYFRCISGNTQVNATEVRLMKIPSRCEIKEIGRSVGNKQALDQDEIDSIVQPYIGSDLYG